MPLQTLQNEEDFEFPKQKVKGRLGKSRDQSRESQNEVSGPEHQSVRNTNCLSDF